MPPMEYDTEPTRQHKRRKVKEEGEQEDRLSDLPNGVLTHMMTFMTTKDCVRTSVLSKRWKDVWKGVPSLSIHSSCVNCDCRNRVHLAKFDRFVSKFLSLRDDAVPITHLDFVRKPFYVGVGRSSAKPLTKIVKYAGSHNVQHMKLAINSDIDLQHCLLKCKTLTSLELEGCRFEGEKRLFPKPLSLVALERLRVCALAFSGDGEGLVEPFSSCVKLKSLTLEYCDITDSENFYISNDTLTNLTIWDASNSSRLAGARIVLSTPNLLSFTYSGFAEFNPQQISASNLSRLQEVNIDIRTWMASQKNCLDTAYVLIEWLQLFGNVESMTTTSCTLQILNSIPDLLNCESPRLEKLKSLIVLVRDVLPVSPSGLIPDAAMDYLIRNSSSAKVTTRKWGCWSKRCCSYSSGGWFDPLMYQ